MKIDPIVGVYTSITEEDISEAQPLDECPEQHEIKLPPHLISLYAQAKKNCANPGQEEQVSSLLVQYQDVFSKGSDDEGANLLGQA